jgi:FkbM family methyltransferase
MRIWNFLRNRDSLLRNTRWSWRLLGDSLRIGSWRYKATTAGSGLSLELIAGLGEWYTFYENLIREDYLQGLAPLREGDHVIDIGANIGAFTVLAASRVGPSGRVYAFEPDPQVCERLRQNLRINGLKNVTVHAAAVGAASGHAVFHRHQKNVLSSLHDGVGGGARSYQQSFQVPLLGIREVVDMVQSTSGVGLLKVDCEGSEYDIFDAMDADSAAQVRQISMEVHQMRDRSRDQLIGRLKALGFQRQSKPYPLAAFVRQGVTAA